jgi:hypothetical protein
MTSPPAETTAASAYPINRTNAWGVHQAIFIKSKNDRFRKNTSLNQTNTRRFIVVTKKGYTDYLYFGK